MPKTVQYTTEVPGAPDKAGEGKPRRSAWYTAETLLSNQAEVNSLYDNFLKGCKIAGDDNFLGTRTVENGVAGPYVWQSYNDVQKRAKSIGSALIATGAGKKDNIGLFSINRAEWVIAEQACFMYNLCTVPLYDTLGADAIKYIIEQSEMKTVFATADKVKAVFQLRRDKGVPQLRRIVAMDKAAPEVIAEGKEVGLEVVALADFEASGFANPQDPTPPTLDDLATICYTSGTTGMPKGVMLTHRNFLAFVATTDWLTENGRIIKFGHKDVHISYLPLAHVFERVVQVLLIARGASIGFYQGDTLKLLEDIHELKPTVFCSVPRLFNRIFDKVFANVKAKGGISEYLFNTAYSTKKKNIAGGSTTHVLWDFLVFGKVKDRLGGRVRAMITGSAPISKDVMDFLRISFGAEVYEGYGQTETTAALSVTDREDLSSGHVGVPLPSCEVKLVDVPSMNYTSKDTPNPRGEICVRGNNCFIGYYKAKDKTKETIDTDGWVHTGDVGMWDPQGRLVVIDRVKNIFKLAQGEYIAPEKIEIVYQKHELVAQAFVFGDSLQASLVGVIVPDFEVVPGWAEKTGLIPGAKKMSPAELIKDDKLKKHLLKALGEHGKANDLKGFENVRAIHLEHELFSVENNLLTPTFKLKRFEAKIKYKKEIEEMYAAMTS